MLHRLVLGCERPSMVAYPGSVRLSIWRSKRRWPGKMRFDRFETPTLIPLIEIFILLSTPPHASSSPP